MHQELEGAALTLHAWVEIRINMEPHVQRKQSLESNFMIDFTSESKQQLAQMLSWNNFLQM